jgi:type IV pilus assembly protein PilO
MKLSDFRNLDRNNIGGWPSGVKLVFCTLVFLVIMVAGWYFEISPQQEELDQKHTKEEALKRDFSEKYAKVVNLEALKVQLEEMSDMLRQLLLQLPNKTEMPKLLVDISQAALSVGLETQLFQPGPETVKEGFYAEKPIQIRMQGTYHQFGSFISAVAALPRVVILTMRDVSLKPTDAKAVGQLSLEGTVNTYHSVEEEDSAGAAKAPAKPGAPGSAPPAQQGGK